MAQLFLLLFFFHIVRSSSIPSSSSSWSTLRISPNELCSMEYRNFRISIYEHADNSKSTTDRQKRYFYAPIALLDHSSAVSEFNNVTNEAEMRFRIEMWDEQVQSLVVDYVSRFVQQQVEPNCVQVMRLEKVVLANTKPSPVYSVSSSWLPYKLQKSLWFSLTCLRQEDCDKMADAMRVKPHQFEHLKLLFSLESQTTQTRETLIRIDNIVSGDMVSKLMQHYDANTEPLLTAQDEKRLLKETMTNVIVETFDDSDVVSPNSESQIYNALKELLVSSRLTIKDQSDTMWNSVFWNDDNYRPDKTTKTLNSFYEKLDEESQKKMAKEFEINTKTGVSLEARVLKFIRGSAAFNAEFSGRGSQLKEDAAKIYQESKDDVSWDGEKFVPKPLSLARINLNKLRDKQSMKDRNVRVRYSTAVLSTPIQLVDNVRPTDRALAVQHRMPTSCQDLQQAGHFASGFYSVIGAQFMETVYCNFTHLAHETGFETKIGYEDVKSKPTYFYVQKKTSFRRVKTPIPFELERINVGGAMNSSSGVFTAQRNGQYQFSLSGVAKFGSNSTGYIGVALMLNASPIGRGHTEGFLGVKGYQTFSLQSMLDLKSSDKLWLEIDYLGFADLHEDAYKGTSLHYTHFTGWLVEEDILTTLANDTVKGERIKK